MDRLKDMASSAGGGGGLGDMLKGIDFPIQKDQLVSHLEQHGAPSQITDKLRGDSTDQYQNQDDVMSKVTGLM